MFLWVTSFVLAGFMLMAAVLAAVYWPLIDGASAWRANRKMRERFDQHSHQLLHGCRAILVG